MEKESTEVWITQKWEWKWRTHQKSEETFGWRHTQKSIQKRRDVSTLTDAFFYQKRVNICEHTVRIASHDTHNFSMSFVWRPLHFFDKLTTLLLILQNNRCVTTLLLCSTKWQKVNLENKWIYRREKHDTYLQTVAFISCTDVCTGLPSLIFWHIWQVQKTANEELQTA